jgi:hypothetical protein
MFSLVAVGWFFFSKEKTISDILMIGIAILMNFTILVIRAYIDYFEIYAQTTHAITGEIICRFIDDTF